ncbi:hypothetical protein NDU88_007354 [Pleurodeles waltl]|uniref:Uncharacterized protein n=1 Tax=Pleurodeles waltl TaxID=8319 RepID=A0AAV7PTC9_PLEWA|nr:hypothetical protein NDU88_007354 [Pleurodeles waltl]
MAPGAPRVSAGGLCLPVNLPFPLVSLIAAKPPASCKRAAPRYVIISKRGVWPPSPIPRWFSAEKRSRSPRPKQAARPCRRCPAINKMGNITKITREFECLVDVEAHKCECTPKDAHIVESHCLKHSFIFEVTFRMVNFANVVLKFCC